MVDPVDPLRKGLLASPYEKTATHCWPPLYREWVLESPILSNADRVHNLCFFLIQVSNMLAIVLEVDLKLDVHNPSERGVEK